MLWSLFPEQMNLHDQMETAVAPCWPVWRLTKADNPRPTLLFVSEILNIAETTRMIEIARACGDAFHCEVFGYGGEYQHLIDPAGFMT